MRNLLLITALLLLLASCEGQIPISSTNGANPPGLANALKKHVPSGSLTRGLDAPPLLDEQEQIDDVLARLHETLLNIMRDIADYDTLPISALQEYRTFGTGQIDYSGYMSHQVTAGNWHNASADLACSLNDYTPDDSLFFGGGLLIEYKSNYNWHVDDGFYYRATFSGILDMGGLYSAKVTLDEIEVVWSAFVASIDGEALFESDSISGMTIQFQ